MKFVFVLKITINLQVNFPVHHERHPRQGNVKALPKPVTSDVLEERIQIPGESGTQNIQISVGSRAPPEPTEALAVARSLVTV